MAPGIIFFACSIVNGQDPGRPDPILQAVVNDIHAGALLTHVDGLVACGTRRWDQPGGRQAQEIIRSFLENLGLDEVIIQDFDEGTDNVIGILRGARDPERVHVLGAHYDSWSHDGPTAPAPGADDNASGTAALLEAARAIAASGRRPSETIVFAAFSGEENGLTGSRAYVAGLAAGGQAVADMVAVDVVGYVEPGTEPHLSVTSSEFTPEINALISRLGDVAAAYLPSWRFEGGPGCG